MVAEENAAGENLKDIRTGRTSWTGRTKREKEEVCANELDGIIRGDAGSCAG